MTRIYTGGCLCGQVRYRHDGPLRDIVACHCDQCRKTSGHFVAATQAEDSRNLEITGEVTWYQSSQTARRGFCGVCGSNLFWQPGDGQKTSIFAGTLDSSEGLKLVQQIHTETQGGYYELPDVPIVKQSDL